MTAYDYNEFARAQATTLRQLPKLRGHATIPDRVVVPCVIVVIADDGPADDFEGAVTVNWKALFLASKADTRTAQETMNTYRSRGNPESVIDQMEANPGPADYTVWTGTGEPQRFEVGGIEYAGCEFNFESALG